ncbi:ABC transporter ATP-binding protein [Candidatus Methylobacter oryzae]|uniref:ABC transporter ATP-binding protein n=1 Tax=Candidatus Methylobacter oryzae TaxID=2497749 RepID=A0ABY3C917_9GAMM|nr:ABC transporter ATP-binding protein [Candidatus Methylobacter oryzae]TRW92916.1 ABC transporter ATP-binding protein [Candidatus Methylobacter oryzae]
MNASSLAVRCQNLVKVYDTGGQKVTALNGVNLEIAMGELMMLVGPSGCGKTTLISVIAGILDQDSGCCEVFGEDLLNMSNQRKLDFRARNIGFVFQAFNLLPSLSAAENVSVPLIINGMKRSDAERRAAAVLEQVGLGARTTALSSQLSGGQQQRVAIARALVHSPRLIVCDEPTSSLDHQTGHNVMTLLKDVALHNDRALVIVTHDARIFDFADRIAEMDDGHIVKVQETRDKVKG